MRLRRSCPDEPGIQRRGRGKGFEYLRQGSRIEDAETLDRLRALAIPPAWKDVWICKDLSGHLQATGTDAAGRRQYLYHEDWRRRRDQEKFERLTSAVGSIVDLRRAVRRDLADRSPTRERALAGGVRLLDRGALRVGSERYAKVNGSAGLTTLERRHVRISHDSTIHLSFVGKAGIRQRTQLQDPDLAPLLRTLKRRRGGGTRLLAYRTGDRWTAVRAADINGYLRDRSGVELSAKDLRTWHAGSLFAWVLAAQRRGPDTEQTRRQVMDAAIGSVSDSLGNTPAVCRRSYIDPRLIDLWMTGELSIPAAGGPLPTDDAGRDRLDRALAAQLDAASEVLQAAA